MWSLYADQSNFSSTVIKEIGKCLVNCEKITKLILANPRFLIYHSLHCVREALMVLKKPHNTVIKTVCKHKNVMIYAETIIARKWCVFTATFFLILMRGEVAKEVSNFHSWQSVKLEVNSTRTFIVLRVTRQACKGIVITSYVTEIQGVKCIVYK